MTAPAAPSVGGRRPSFGFAVAVVAFLYAAPPLFLLAPLWLLLLFSKPRSLREWIWIVLAAAGTIKLVADLGQGPLLGQVIAAGALFATGAFLLLVHLFPGAATVPRALAAIALSAIAVAVWSAAAGGISLGQVDEVVAAGVRRDLDQIFPGAPAEQMGAAAAATVRIFPGLLAVQGLAGLGLAWGWYHRVAATPLGPAPGRFADLRFAEYLIWGAIFTLGLALAPLGDPITRVAQCGLVVWVGLYGIRGLAVVVRMIQGWPLPGKLLLAVLSFLASPIAIGTLVAIGLADNWLDFRNRTVPTAGGGNADGSDSP